MRYMSNIHRDIAEGMLAELRLPEGAAIHQQRVNTKSEPCYVFYRYSIAVESVRSEHDITISFHNDYISVNGSNWIDGGDMTPMPRLLLQYEDPGLVAKLQAVLRVTASATC